MRRASRIAAIGALLKRAFQVSAGVVALAIPAASVCADVMVYSVRTAGTGAPATTTGNVEWTGNQGFDVVRFYAKFVNGPVNGNIENTDPLSNGLGAIGGTLISSQGFKFDFTRLLATVDATRPYANLDFNADRMVNRYNNTGLITDIHADNTNVNTMIGIQNWDSGAAVPNNFGPVGFYMISDNPSKYLINSDSTSAIKTASDSTTTTPRSISDSTNDVDPRYLYQSPATGYAWAAPGAVNPNPNFARAFRVEGALTNGDGSVDPSAKSSDPNYARGALVAIAVVPTGSTVRFVSNANGEAGGIGDDHNHKNQFDVTDAIPEPGSISLLTLGAIGLLARRSRKQA